MSLYTNTNYRKDFLRFQLEKWGKNRDIYIASAFFDNSEIIKYFIENNCNIKLIVRLDHGTNAIKLEEIVNLNNVLIRYYTGRRFHPKFYLFKNGIAFVGSSNLTHAGLMTNNEANVEISSDSFIFEELESQFNLYWASARVLDKEVLQKYQSSIRKAQSDLDNLKYEIDKEIENQFGNVAFSDVNLDKPNYTKLEIFVEDFKKEYQLFLNNFEFLRSVYLKHGKRKVSENTLPLRIEIDQFFNWIRTYKCHKNDYENAPIREKYDLEQNIVKNIDEYISSDMKYFDIVVEESYPILTKVFQSQQDLEKLNVEELSKGLERIHAFYDQFRFFSGGYQTLYDTFINENGLEKIKNALIYILFNKEKDYKTRIGNYLNNPELRLVNFGDSCAKEFYGWLNNEDVPIFNKRTYYTMRWLGFGNW